MWTFISASVAAIYCSIAESWRCRSMIRIRTGSVAVKATRRSAPASFLPVVLSVIEKLEAMSVPGRDAGARLGAENDPLDDRPAVDEEAQITP